LSVISIVETFSVDNLTIRIGIENELFTLNEKGFIIPASKIVVKEIIRDITNRSVDVDLLKGLIYGIQWEPHPAQLEIVTQPLDVFSIRKAIEISRKYIAQVAKRKHIKIYSGSAHPVQSNPFPLNGTHVSISIYPRRKRGMPRKFLTYVHNNIRRHIPELIALTANSPIIAGEFSGFMSSRLVYSRVLRPSSYAIIKRSKTTIIPREKRALLKYAFVFADPKKFENKVVVNSAGLRFLDITPRGPFTNIIEDRWTSPGASRVETRFIDNPSSTEYMMDIVYILLGLSLEAIHKLFRNEKIAEPDNLQENRRRAIKYGVDAKFISDGSEIPARECIRNMLDRVAYYLDMLDIKLRTSLARGIPEIKHYGLPQIYVPNEETMNHIKAGRVLMKIELSSKRELITIEGKTRMLREGAKVFGLVFPEYKFSWVENEENMVSRFTKIEIAFWILTQHGYVPLKPNDRILFSISPIGRLVRMFSYVRKKL